jgi:hypothetical protein
MGPRQMGQGFESPEELEVLLLDSSFMALLSLKAKPIRSYHIYSLCPIIFDPQKIKIKKNLPGTLSNSNSNSNYLFIYYFFKLIPIYI